MIFRLLRLPTKTSKDDADALLPVGDVAKDTMASKGFVPNCVITDVLTSYESGRLSSLDNRCGVRRFHVIQPSGHFSRVRMKLSESRVRHSGVKIPAWPQKLP